MSTYTTNYNLEKPDSGDDFKDFRSNYNSNMDIIDANLGGGGGGGNVDDVLVNGVSVVDGNHDAQITSYKEVTQAEYDALPATKLTDGIAYFIKDAGGGGGGSSSHNYSTTEQVIGTWIDGKPVYECTFYLATASLSSKEFSISTGLSNIKKILTCTGVLTNGSETYTLPYERLTERESIRTFARVNSDGTVTLNVITGVGGASVYSTVTDVYVTITYTKTTD